MLGTIGQIELEGFKSSFERRDDRQWDDRKGDERLKLKQYR